ncbi:protease inhibitor I9 family protein [Rhizobium jaguaris]|nr:protease inhibitor I9 family protein [Rhizobium jaguaris]
MKVDESLSREVESARLTGRAVPVIITMRNAEDVKFVLESGIKASVTFQHIPAVAASLTSDQIEQLAAMPQVELIELDTEANALRKP